MTAQQAISRSIRQNEIVHLPYDTDLAASLLVEADDNFEDSTVLECWGGDEDDGGEPWRVHLDKE